MSRTIWVVRVGNRDGHDEAAFETLEASEKHGRKELIWRWKRDMDGTMPKDLDEAIENFGEMSSSFDQLEINEMTVR